jgi:ATP-dependent Clp protease ATP-binding subunit ClpA
MIEKMSPVTARILRRALVEAESAGKDAVEPMHLLIGIIQEGRNAAATMLSNKQITELECRDADFKK